MTMQPTSGPWLVEPINGGQTYQITSAENKHFKIIAETPIDGTGADEANAYLIAAAPTLLKALKLFLSCRNPETGGWTITAGKASERGSTNLAYAEAIARGAVAAAELDDEGEVVS